MAKGDKITIGPYWTKHWIENMWRFTSENFIDFDTGFVDFEALGREEYEFRKALFFRNFKNSPRAQQAFEEADEDYNTKVENGKKGGRPRKNTTGDAPHREDGEDDKPRPSSEQLRSGKPTATSTNDPAVTAPSAGGSCAQSCSRLPVPDKRRQPDGWRPTASNGVVAAHTTIAPADAVKAGKVSQDAPTRKDGVDSKSATSCTPSADGTIREEALNVPGPEGSALESGTSATPLPYTISTDAKTHGGRNAANTSPAGAATAGKPFSPEVLNLAYSGEFGNVVLTQGQYSELLLKFGNKRTCDNAIDSLSARLENGETKAKNHYATLVKWAAYRDDRKAEKEQERDAEPGETYLEKNWKRALAALNKDAV